MSEQNTQEAPLFGIDMSKWQGADFSITQAMIEHGVQFVVIKCGGSDNGRYTDKQFENNYRKAKQAGIPCGVYWFSKALNHTDALRDADYVVKLLAGKQFELPVYIDVEHKDQLALGKDKLTEVVTTFCEYLEQSGFYAGIYSSASFFKNHMHYDRVKRFALWVASWSTKRPDFGGMWQFGGETNKLRSNKINGITVDQDYLYVDYMSAIKRLGLNGYGYNEADTYARDVLAALVAKGYSVATLSEILRRIGGEET